MVPLEQKDDDIPNLLNQGLPSNTTAYFSRMSTFTEGKLVSLHLRPSQGPNQLELRENHT